MILNSLVSEMIMSFLLSRKEKKENRPGIINDQRNKDARTPTRKNHSIDVHSHANTRPRKPSDMCHVHFWNLILIILVRHLNDYCNFEIAMMTEDVVVDQHQSTMVNHRRRHCKVQKKDKKIFITIQIDMLLLLSLSIAFSRCILLFHLFD